jgi:hypothetical protein
LIVRRAKCRQGPQPYFALNPVFALKISRG